MIFLAALLAGAMSILFVFGIKELVKRDIKASRFSAFKYDASEELNIPKIEKKKKSSANVARDLLLILLGGGILAGVMMLVTGKVTIAFISAFGGIITPRLWNQQRSKKDEKVLAVQIEQAAEVMGMVISSGGGMPDALERAIVNAKQPLRAELEQASAELKLGVPEPEVFRRLADRVQIEEMEMLSVASSLQKEGMAVNMASVFKQIQANLRSRQAFQEEVKAITSANRLAVWVVSCVPVFTIAIMRLFAPDFVAPLFETFIGVTVLILCSIVIIIGIIWALKIANSDDFI